MTTVATTRHTASQPQEKKKLFPIDDPSLSFFALIAPFVCRGKELFLNVADASSFPPSLSILSPLVSLGVEKEEEQQKVQRRGTKKKNKLDV